MLSAQFLCQLQFLEISGVPRALCRVVIDLAGVKQDQGDKCFKSSQAQVSSFFDSESMANVLKVCVATGTCSS